VFKEKKIGMEQ